MRLAVVLLVTVLCLGWVFWDLELGDALASIQGVRWDGIGLVITSYCITHAFRVVRLQLLLDQPVRFGRVLSLLSIGYLAIQVVPLRMGEFVRPYLLAEREGVPFGSALAAILLERLADMILLLCMFLGVAWAVQLPGVLIIENIDIIKEGQRVFGSLVLVGIAGVAGVLIVGERVLKWTDRLPLGGLLRRFDEGIRLMAQQPLKMVLVLLLSAAIWAVTILGVWLMMQSFQNLPSGLPEAFTTWTVTLGGMTLIPTAGFFGSYELACSSVLKLYGADPASAKVFALVLHLSQFFFTIGIGSVFLILEGLSLKELIGRSQAAAQADKRA
jgi:uncharacterized protein (TIRG00374 family)